MRQKKYDEAIAFGSRALRVHTNDPDALLIVGSAYLSRGGKSDMEPGSVALIRAAQLGNKEAQDYLTGIGVEYK